MIPQARSLSTFLATLLLSTGPALAGNVLVVDAGGGGAYLHLQPAVDAATDGDVILVKSGTYGTFVVDNKALAIVGDLGATVQITGAIQARNIAAAKTLVLENLTATGISSSDLLASSGISFVQNLGHLRAERCVLKGKFQDTSPSSCSACYSGLRAQSSADVAVMGCSVTGGQRVGFNGGLGISLNATNAIAYDSDVLGGHGVDNCNGGTNGGGGCLADQSTLFAFNCSFHGGEGGNTGYGQPLACPNPGDGGYGVSLTNSSAAYLLSTLTLGGTGGYESGLGCPNHSGCGYTGNPGVPRVGAPFTDLSGNTRTMVSPTPVRESTSPVLQFTGQPGDQVYLLVAQATKAQYVPQWLGTLLLDLSVPPLVFDMGVVPASGVLRSSITLPDLGPGVQGVVRFIQPVFLEPQVHRYLGTPSCMVVLDSAF